MSVFVHDVKSSSEDKVIINGDRHLGRRGMEFNHRIVTFVSALLSYSYKRHVMGDCILNKINTPIENKCCFAQAKVTHISLPETSVRTEASDLHRRSSSVCLYVFITN